MASAWDLETYVLKFYLPSMTKIPVFLIILSALMLLLSCSMCDFEGIEKETTGNVSFEITLSKCYGSAPARQASRGLHITSRSQFLNFFPKQTAACALGDSLDLNFKTHHLLSYYTEGKCNTFIERDVQFFLNDRRVVYRVTQEDCGRCGRDNLSANLIAIPAVDEDVVVEFEFTKL